VEDAQRTVLIRLAFAALGFVTVLAAQPATPGQQARIVKLQNALRAPCCWNEPVARHQSEVAEQMRAEITGFVMQGRSDSEILDYYKQKYGLRILVEPEGRLWWVMHGVPLAALGAGLVIVAILLKRWLRPPASS
jgi:cytochrome c-type biogenesis protein CcmH